MFLNYLVPTWKTISLVGRNAFLSRRRPFQIIRRMTNKLSHFLNSAWPMFYSNTLRSHCCVPFIDFSCFFSQGKQPTHTGSELHYAGPLALLGFSL